MLSLDPATVGTRRLPRDLPGRRSARRPAARSIVSIRTTSSCSSRLSGACRSTPSTGFTLAGGPVGEPALGPVAFMHRASAADNPTAPLGHHTFDSTHVAFGVVTAAVDRGPSSSKVRCSTAASRTSIDGTSISRRSTRFRAASGIGPTTNGSCRRRRGRLTNPEQLEARQRGPLDGLGCRGRASAATRSQSVTAAFGRNDTDSRRAQRAAVEGARRRRAERDLHAVRGAAGRDRALLHRRDRCRRGGRSQRPGDALTVGGVRDVLFWRGFEDGVGADLTVDGVPEALQAAYSAHPISIHVFFRLSRPPARWGGC